MFYQKLESQINFIENLTVFYLNFSHLLIRISKEQSEKIVFKIFTLHEIIFL